MAAYQNYYNTYPQQNNQQMMYQQQNPYMQMQDMSYRQQPTILQSGFIQQQQNRSIIGGFVDNFDLITANDVPMQTPATFIKNDGSEIQIRSWNASGTISTTVYKPILSGQNDNTENDKATNGLEALNDDMRAFREEINARFDKLEKSIGGSGRSRTKKEVEVNQDESI